jgi:hypothetical protein
MRPKTLTLVRPLLVAATLTLTASLVGVAPAQGALPLLRSGDAGAPVRQWQQRLNVWLSSEQRANIRADGRFGAATVTATQAFQRAQDLRSTGVVDDRTRAALYEALNSSAVRWEWPVPLPQWWWAWAQWRLGRAEYRGHGNAKAFRPRSAPLTVPSWAFRRLTRLQRVAPQRRAMNFVEQRLRRQYGVGGVDVRTLRRSNSDERWIRVTGVYQEPVHRIWAAWLEVWDGRWWLQYLGVDATAVQPTPASVRTAIPCDLRPAFATPRC